jgi:hypothetical protein
MSSDAHKPIGNKVLLELPGNFSLGGLKGAARRPRSF